MTTAISQRCVHCQLPYIYHPSFYGGDEINYPYNHHDFCPGCYKVVKEALEKVSTKYEKRFIAANEYTREQIIQHQEARCASGISMRRIFPSLIDMSGTARHMIVCELMPDENWYKAEWWSNTPEIVEITKEVWVKCQK